MRTPFLWIGFALVLAVGLPPAHAAEDWTRQELGNASLSLPGSWIVRRDVSSRWLSAVDPKAPFVTLLLERVDLARMAVRGTGDARCRAFAAEHLAREKAATREGIGFRVEETGNGRVSSWPACWTLVDKSGGMPDRLSLYLHTAPDDHGYMLRIDVPREDYAERRDVIRRIVDSLLLGRVDASPEERVALARVLDAMAADPPKTRRAYRAWLHELDLVGASALPHMKALARRYVDGPGFDDVRARAFLGDRRFHHPLPEEIAFRGHPFLEAVEEANAKEWFRSDEDADWAAAADAWRRTRLHHERLVSDRRYRAGDQVFANLALEHRFERLRLEFAWADPFAMVFVSSRGREDAPALLAERAKRLQRVYRAFLQRYAESLDLRDLMAPWGGRPGGNQSFPDGAPLPVIVHGDGASFVEAMGAKGYGPWSRPMPRTLLLKDGTLLLRVDTEGAEARSGEVEVGATMQLLHWFARQKSKWGRPQMGPNVFADGFEEWFAGCLELGGGEPWVLHDMRSYAGAIAKETGAYPVIPLADLLGFATSAQIGFYGVERWQLPTRLAVRLFRHQAWALVHMLNEGHGAKYRERFLEWMDAYLQRETQHGMALQVFKRTFGLRDEADWDAFEALWQAYVRELVGEDAPAVDEVPPRGPPLDLVIHHTEEEGESVTRVVLQRRNGIALAMATLGPEPDDDSPVGVTRMLGLVKALWLSKDLGPRRVAIRILHRPANGPFPPWEDLRLVLLALLVTGHEDITFEGSTREEARAFLDAWR